MSSPGENQEWATRTPGAGQERTRGCQGARGAPGRARTTRSGPSAHQEQAVRGPGVGQGCDLRGRSTPGMRQERTRSGPGARQELAKRTTQFITSSNARPPEQPSKQKC